MFVTSAANSIRTENKLFHTQRCIGLETEWESGIDLSVKKITWTVLSNHRLIVFHWLPPPWIIWRTRLVSTRLLTSSSSSTAGRNGWSMQTIMLDDSIDWRERALIKSTQKNETDSEKEERKCIQLNEQKKEELSAPFKKKMGLVPPVIDSIWLGQHWWKGAGKKGDFYTFIQVLFFYIYFERWHGYTLEQQKGRKKKKRVEHGGELTTEETGSTLE